MALKIWTFLKDVKTENNIKFQIFIVCNDEENVAAAAAAAIVKRLVFFVLCPKDTSGFCILREKWN